MTKPQSSAEPSMEDILASIRKMISEERMGPRPIPDQMRAPPMARARRRRALRPPPRARPGRKRGPTPAASAQSRVRSDPRPEVLPQRAPMPADRPAPAADRFGRAPGEEFARLPSVPSRSAARPSAQFRIAARSIGAATARSRADRSGPSFSSLSDALKAAKSPAEQRRSLEEKIADMLESGPSSPAPGAAPADPLAVFSGNRTMPAGASAAPVRPAGAPEPDAKSAPSRAPAPLPTAPPRPPT